MQTAQSIGIVDQEQIRIKKPQALIGVADLAVV